MRSRLARVARRVAGEVADPYADMEPAFGAFHQQVAPHTMTSIECVYAMHRAARYVTGAAIPGDVVECGVWQGGNMMMAALTLTDAGDQRQLWLYDTFEGMSEPTERDRRWNGEVALDRFLRTRRGEFADWCYAPLETVQRNMASTGYPEQLVRCVKGKVEDTIPADVPEQIALLRLDTDWYESTKHELEHLWDRLSPGGVMFIDDYGAWQGSREAVDEFFARRGIEVMLHRVDRSCRAVTKV
jgi:O-methyltransferase